MTIPWGTAASDDMDLWVLFRALSFLSTLAPPPVPWLIVAAAPSGKVWRETRMCALHQPWVPSTQPKASGGLSRLGCSLCSKLWLRFWLGTVADVGWSHKLPPKYWVPTCCGWTERPTACTSPIQARISLAGCPPPPAPQIYPICPSLLTRPCCSLICLPQLPRC